MKIFLISILLTGYIFNAPFTNLIGSKELSVFTFLILIFVAVARKKFRIAKNIFMDLQPFLFLLIFVIFVTSIWIILRAPAQLYLPILLVRYVLESLIISAAFFLYVNKWITFLKIMRNAGLFQISMIIIMFISPQLKDFYLSLISQNTGILSYYQFRMLGLTGILNYSSSIVLAACSCCAIILSLECPKKRFLNFFVGLLALVIACFGARTVVVFCIYAFSVLMLQRHLSMRLSKHFFIGIGMLYSLFNVLMFVETDLNVFIQFISEPIVRYITTNSLGTGSSDTLLKWYNEFNYNTPALGFGLYVNTDGTYFGGIDAGILRLILYWGLPLTIVILSAYAIFYAFLFYNLYANLYCHREKRYLISISFVGLSFIGIGMIKGNFLIDGSMYILIFILLSFYASKSFMRYA